MRIAILNQPTGNRGDEAAHKAFVRSIANTMPDCQVDVIFILERQTNIDEFNVKLSNIGYINATSVSLGYVRVIHWCYIRKLFFLSYLHPLLWKYKHILKRYDKVICAPGGMCMGGFKNWMHIWALETAKRLHKPIYYWGRSIGPFPDIDVDSKVFKQNSINLLKCFSFTCLRDSISIKYAEELGIKAVETVDSVFLDRPQAAIPENILQQIGTTDYIVFVPNELTWHPRYKKDNSLKIDEFFLSLMDLLVTRWPDRKIVMLPQTYKSSIDDFSYFKRLASKSGKRNILVIDENQSSDIQQTIIACSKLVIGARYHSIVFAINNEVPFISLSYEHKMKGLLERLLMTKYLVEIQDIFDKGNEEQYNLAIEKVGRLLTEKIDSVSRLEANIIVQEKFDELIRQIKG